MMPNQQRCANKGSVLPIVHMLHTCATSSRDDESALLLGMAAKALAQLQAHSDRMRQEAIDWKDKCEEMGQLGQELEDTNDDLVHENGQLRVKCQELEEYGLAGMSEQSECGSISDMAMIEASPVQDADSPTRRPRSFSGDVYKQLEQFELSIDLELEEFQRLGLLSVNENEKDTGAKTCTDVLVRDTPSEMVVSEDPQAPSRNPLHLLTRMFQPQEDAPMPAMVTSDSLFSLSSDCSINTRSTSDFLSFGSTKKSMKASPQRNAEWAIIE